MKRANFMEMIVEEFDGTLPKFRDESPGIHAGDESRLTNS